MAASRIPGLTALAGASVATDDQYVVFDTSADTTKSITNAQLFIGLGLGTMATQAASSVLITGGEITGIVDLAVADGGTGASTAGGALTNFGLSANGQSLVTAANYAAMKALLDLEIGIDVQAYDADLTTWAGVTPAAGITTFLATPSSANLIAAVTDETGTGALVFGTSPGFTTAANPVSNDGASLGISGTAWSDLFLASGAVINFNAGDVTVTHSANTLAFAGASSGYTFDAAVTISGGTVWHSGNDGAGSGLDADLLDGKTVSTSGNAIPLLDGTNTWSGIQTYSAVINMNNAVALNIKETGGTARSAIKMDATDIMEFGNANNAAEFLNASNAFTNAVTISGGTVWHSGNDGAGSGLDADLLDGKNTGTSGNVVPLLDGTNTWSGQQLFSYDFPTRFNRAATAVQIELDTGGTVRGYIGADATYSTILYNGSGTACFQLTHSTGIVGIPYGITPTANDGAALGASGTAWSDLFLASGGVINFNAGNVTITHSAGLLTLNGNIATSDGYGDFYNTAATESAVYSTASHATFTGNALFVNAVRAATSSYNLGIMYSGNSGDTEFKFSGDGNGTCDGAWTGGGADYAEYFEWEDGNPNNEDRRGMSVIMSGDKIRLAQALDNPSRIIGIVSANPSIVGDAAELKWAGKHLRDDFGTYIYEPYSQVEWDEAVGEEPAPTPEDEKAVKLKTEPRSFQHDNIPEGVKVPEDARVITHDEDGKPLMRRKLNPDFDPNEEYVPRKDRKEWSPIGLMGKLKMRKGQPTGDRWVKMRDENANVELWLVR